MIFRRSLSKRKGAAYSFFSGMSSAFIPASVICIILSGMMALLPAVQFIMINSEAKESLSQNAKTAKDTFRFLVFGTTDFADTAVIFIFLGILGILSIITAVRIFNFICDKRTVNVYYSLGIKRMTLFMTKYFSGALLLCAAAAVAVTLSYIVNMIFLGLSFQLLLVTIHFYCGLSVFLLICYSVTAAVFSSVGTISEAVVYSVSLLFAPTIFIFIIQQIITAFIPSSTYNIYVEDFMNMSYSYSSAESLLEATSDYNPVLFFADEILTYSAGIFKDDKTYLSAVEQNWKFPNVFLHFPWFIIASALSFLGAFLFRRLKAENCGFLNTNKLLSNLTIFQLCLFGSCLFISEIRWSGMLLCLGMGAAVAFVLYIIAEIFLKRNFKKILISLYKFVAHMAVIAIILTVCITDAFGYASYIPKKTDIESVQIAVPFYYSEISLATTDYGWNSDGLFRFYTPYHLKYMPDMTTDNDIETVLSINKTVNNTEADDGTYCNIIIRYNLKNGKTSERQLTLTSREEVNALFTLFDTDAYKDTLKNLFYEENRVDKIKQFAAEHPYNYIDDEFFNYLAFDYETSVVIARSPSLQENKVLNLTKEQFASLKDALYTDILTQNSYEYFTGSMEQLGVISLGITDEARYIEGINGYSSYYDEPVTYLTEGITYSYTTEYPTEAQRPIEETVTEIFTEDDLSEEISEDNEILYDDDEPYEEDSPEEIPEKPVIPPQYKDIYTEAYEGLGNLAYNHTYDIVITKGMLNTVSFLEKEGFSDCFTSSLTVESVSFRENSPDKIFNYYSYKESYIGEFFAYAFSEQQVSDMTMYEDSAAIEVTYTENIIKDTEKLTELSSLMKLHGYTYGEGYLCLIKYTDGSYSVRYLPENTAPDYVRNYNYTMDEPDDGYYYY